VPARPFSVNDLYGLYRTYEQGQRAGDESYNPALDSGFMSEADFNALPEQERMRLAGQYTTGGTNVYEENGNLVGYGDPRFIEEGRWYNPEGMTTDDNGRFSISGDAVNWDALDAIQNATDRSGFFNGTPLQNFMRGAGIVLGVGNLANAGWLDFLPGMEELGTVPVDGMLPESVAPQVTEPMMPDPFAPPPFPNVPVDPPLTESVPPQVTEPMLPNPYEFPQIPVDPPLTESIPPEVTEPMLPNPFDRPWWQDILDLGRDLLPGGSGGGQGGGVFALGGEAPRIGDHAQINDPYGLIASGWGPWSGLLDTPKGKVLDALAKRQRTRGI